METEILKRLYIEEYGVAPKIEPIAGGGSSRRYYRLISAEGNAIGVAGDDIHENRTFINLTEIFKKAGIKVGRIIRVSPDHSYYIVEDLGSKPLLEALSGTDKMNLARKALKELMEIQTLPPETWRNSTGYKPFSERLVKWDLNYFKYDFLKPASIYYDEEKLEDDFEKLTKELSSETLTRGFMYRDFQSRNILIKDKELYFIDYQGGREGPVAYDAISFIWQAKAPFNPEEREELENYYADLVSRRVGRDNSRIKKELGLMRIFRTLQVLGAYGFRGIIERKPHFIASLPGAIKNLNYFREKGYLDPYPEIKRIAKILADKWGKPEEPEQKSIEGLTLTIFSFSYKKGYPEDKSGNGGGFMFDCRGLHNPGRYDEYKKLTGKDEPVEKFLRERGEADKFVEKALEIVTPSVEKYIERKFTSLQVGFGCTGGQHRSVYCAESFGRIMKDRFPEIKVIIIHQEQPHLNIK